MNTSMVTLLIMGKIFHSRYILLMHRINEQRLLKTSKEEGKIWYMPDIRPRTTEEGEGERKRSQFLAAGMLAPVRMQAWQAWGSGGGRQSRPPPERSTAARRAAWWQERGRKGERKQKRSAGQKNCVSAIMGGWQAGLVLGERQGGRSMKVGARLVSRPRLRPRTAVHLPADNRI